MSGIVRFFGGLLPLDPPAPASATTAGSSRTHDATRPSSSGHNDDDQPGASSASASAAATDTAGGGGADEQRRPGPLTTAEEYGRSLVKSSADDGANITTRTNELQDPSARSTVSNTTKSRMTYQQWSTQRRRAFERYMNRRMVQPSRANNEDDDEEDGVGDPSAGNSEDGTPKSSSLLPASSSSESSILLETSTATDGGTPNSRDTMTTGSHAGKNCPSSSRLASPVDPAATKDSGGSNKNLSESMDTTMEVADAELFNIPFLETQEQPGDTQPDNMQIDAQPDTPPDTQPDTQDESPSLLDTQDPSATIDMDIERETPSRSTKEESETRKRKKKEKQLTKAQRKAEKRKRDKHKILHESQTIGIANTVDEVNLRVANVNLDLCRVVSVSPFRKTNRLRWQVAENSVNKQDDDESPDSEQQSVNREELGEPPKMMGEIKMLSCPFDGFEDDGPLSSIYRSVLSLEVVEVADEEKEEARREERRMFQRPFETDKTTRDEADASANSSLQQQQKRRIRIFLHGKYAAKVSRLMSDWKYRETANGKKCALAGDGREELLISLRNVPARCVLPYYAHRQTGIETSLLDNELGRRSRYCLCIGSKSHMMVASDDADVGAKLRFDTRGTGGSAADLEMRIVMVRKAAAAAPVVGSPTRAEAEQSDEAGIRFKSTAEAVLSVTAIEEKASEGAAPDLSELALKYGEIVAKKEKRMQRLADEGRRSNELRGTSEHQEQVGNEETKESEDANAGDGTATAASAAPPSRARSGDETAAGQEEQTRKRRRTSLHYLKMAELRPLLESIKTRKHEMRSGTRPYHRIDDTVSVYAVVLSSTAPKRTERGDWMVTLHIIDESLPTTTTINPTNENDGNADNAPGAESTARGTVHVPSITLLVFSHDKAKLPVVRFAGDVIRAHRVVLQEWSNEIQLVGRPRNSSFYVVRPRDGKRMVENPTGQGWVESYTAANPSMLDEEDYLRMRDLWLWGQQRFFAHPTINAKERFTIAEMGAQEDQQMQAGIPAQKTVTGDLTAMIAAIIPVPADQLSDMSPRAYLRLWDGTGPPSSDRMPIDSLFSREAVREGDPPSSALTAISEVVASFADTDPDTDVFEPPRSLCGRVVNAVIWEDTQWDLIRDSASGMRAGKFVRLRNVNDGRLTNSGMRYKFGLRCIL